MQLPIKVNVKNRAVVIILLASILIASILIVSGVQALQTPIEVDSLEWAAQEARARGVNQIFVSVLPLYKDVAGVDDALAQYTVLVAYPVDRRSYRLDSSSIITWNKFRITEILSSKVPTECDQCPLPPTPPSEMLPVGAGNILVPEAGGRLIVDGVTFDAGDPGFLGFEVGQKYLLFLDLDQATQVGGTSIGPAGIFIVNADDTLTAVRHGSPLAEDMVSRYNNSLAQLRAALGATPP
jgi:hypothetical protein